jgi:type VII secretion-associated serine protease mycosin
MPVARTAVAALAVLAGGLTTFTAVPAQADTAGTPPGQAPTAAAGGQSSRDWSRPEASVSASALRVVDRAAPAAGQQTPLRVVSVLERAGVPRVVVETVHGRSRAVQAVEAAQDRSNVVAVSVDTRMHLADATDPALTATTVSNDPMRSSQWALDRLKAETAWGQADGTGAVVAVVDTGVDASHPDLAGRLTAAGADYVSGSGDGHTDPQSHGTHVAGIIAAISGNRVGTAGLAPDARVMPVRVLDADGSGWSSDIAKGIIFATDHGADVVNLSLGGPNADSATRTAVEYAVSHGVVVVAAAGNARNDGNQTNYPAAYPDVVAVASTTQADTSSSFSNTGAYVDVAAPGERILSTVPGGYAYMSGTSMATPYTAAAAALAVDATDGALTPTQFQQSLASTAQDLGSAGWDSEFGVGLVSPVRLLSALSSSTAAPAPAPAETTDPAPVDEPTPAKREPHLRFGTPSGDVVVGQRRSIRVEVADDSTGAPIAGLPVQVLVERGGEVVQRRWLATDDSGAAVTSFRIPATTRFTLRSAADTTTEAAVSAETLKLRAVPDVVLHHRAHRATVRVVDAQGQKVRFQKRRGGRWVTIATKGLDDTGRASMSALAGGRYRAKVTAVPGIAGMRTAGWTI